jgi:YfiH family protein
VTSTPGLALTVVTADCLPVLLADPKRRVVAAVHAGWRGTLSRIVEKTVGVMRQRLGVDPGNVVAAFGPSIQACCYEVGEEVMEEFRSQFTYASDLFDLESGENPADVYLPRQLGVERTAFMRNLGTGKAHLNLTEANYRQLVDAGVKPSRIHRAAPCTACNLDLLCSYRRQGPKSGRLISAIGLRS